MTAGQRLGFLSAFCTLVMSIVIPPAHAQAVPAPSTRQQLDGALRKLRRGLPPDAAAELEALAQSAALTQPELAAEALFKAAQLHDEQLNEPAVARQLYLQTAQRYPDSRFAQRAQRRSAELTTLLTADPAVLTEFNQVASSYLTLGTPEVIARLTRLLADHPDFPQADRATYLLGTAYRLSGRHAAPLAEQTLERVLRKYPTSPWGPYAQQALAEMMLERGNYATARQRFQSLLRYPQPQWHESAEHGLAACERALWRSRTARACWLVLLIVFGTLAIRGRRHLLPLPMEVLYYVPVAAFLVAVTLVGPATLASRTMAGLALGGSLLAWLSGAAAQRAGRLLWNLVSRVLAAGAICYLAVLYGGLLDLLIETWRMGSDSG